MTLCRNRQDPVDLIVGEMDARVSDRVDLPTLSGNTLSAVRQYHYRTLAYKSGLRSATDDFVASEAEKSHAQQKMNTARTSRRSFSRIAYLSLHSRPGRGVHAQPAVVGRYWHHYHGNRSARTIAAVKTGGRGRGRLVRSRSLGAAALSLGIAALQSIAVAHA